MPKSSRYSRQYLYTLARDYLMRHAVSEDNAAITALALLQAEIDGHVGHGLARLQAYAEQAACGKVDGSAVPHITHLSPASMRINANYGFAFPALQMAVSALISAAQESLIAIATIYNSHHCGALGAHVEALAQAGLLGLMFANSPQAIAPWGGSKGVFGTNPIALAVPRQNTEPLVIDLSLSISARGKVMAAAQRGKPIPEGIALDAEGRPTTDAKAALHGTMLPIGGAKGTALCLLVEILTAALAGANFGFEASSFLDSHGEPPATAQTLIAIKPEAFSGASFAQRLEDLIASILSQDGTRLPSQNRQQNRQDRQANGIPISAKIYKIIRD